VTLLDEFIPVMPGCEINDDPLEPICGACRAQVAEAGDRTPIAWLERDARYVEKLATPDVTIADMIGDIDPIKAARAGLQLSNELTMHYGLLPRANRSIFAINELPDLAGKIQVGLFNILQEGDVQIKGYPVRLPLDVLMAFTANPEDYTARGKIITPLKDRIGSEIRTHYPVSRGDAQTITAQEAWISRQGAGPRAEVPPFVAEVVEEIAFQARQDRRVDKRSGVSQRLPISVMENVISNAERRAIVSGEAMAVPRVTDVYAALPSMTGKFELEYEGELKGAETIARELVRNAGGQRGRGLPDAPRPADGHRVVRPRRQPAARRHDERRRRADARPRRAGAGGPGARSRHAEGRLGADARGRRGLRARRAVRHQEDQPQRRARLPRERYARAPPGREAPSLEDEPRIPAGGKKKYYN
jgi:magnesium chelatase subunit I